MSIIDELIDLAEDSPTRDVIIGIHATLVCGKRCGLSSSLLYGMQPHRAVEECGSLTGKTMRQLAELVRSDYLIEASVGMAAINAGLPIDSLRGPILNAKDVIFEKGAGKVVAVIGHFPFVEQNHPFAELIVFEKFPSGKDLRESDIPEHIPRADLVALTATSIPNHTFEGIMEHIRPDAFTIMLGPTTPMTPILFEYGIDALSGSIVRDVEYVKRQVKEGVSFKDIEGTDKITIFRENYAHRRF